MFFLTLAGSGEAETRVKASRFLAIAFPAETEEEARVVLEERSRRFFDATHHCAAWRFRDGQFRALDAGEPSGSAGAPILAAIDGAGLVDTAVIVTRYFGGTKLGVGGLVRAYGEAAALALEAAPRRRGIPAARVEIDYSFEQTSAVMRALERFTATEIEHDFSPADGRPRISAVVPEDSVQDLAETLREQTSGQVAVRLAGMSVIYKSA